MVIYIAEIAIAIEHNRYDTESKIRDGMSEVIKQIDFPYETVSGVEVLLVDKLKKEEIQKNKLTDQECDWIVEKILATKESAYIGISDGSNNCWDSIHFETETAEFETMVSIFDKIKKGL